MKVHAKDGGADKQKGWVPEAIIALLYPTWTTYLHISCYEVNKPLICLINTDEVSVG